MKKKNKKLAFILSAVFILLMVPAFILSAADSYHEMLRDSVMSEINSKFMSLSTDEIISREAEIKEATCNCAESLNEKFTRDGTKEYYLDRTERYRLLIIAIRIIQIILVVFIIAIYTKK